ncbi:ATP-dependent DNA helicase Hel308 [Candidatus Gugararchaeum adminiculabundum]|nr:ATP-dependent DNA helicase Hel308 [Candidatus Gugararchaeum adminiculabundum]
MARIEELIKERFSGYTDIQKLAIPVVSSGKNTLIIAPTGFGKTEAAILPVLAKLESKNGEPGIQALYITPTKSLNRDMMERMTWWCKELKIALAVRHGDTSQSERLKQSKTPPQLLITTPETLQSLLAAKKAGAGLKNVKYVIVDEIHELFDSKRGAQFSIALERLNERAEFQRIGISATVGEKTSMAQFLCSKRMCEIISLSKYRELEIKVENPRANEDDAELAKELFLDGKAVARMKRIKELVEEEKTLIFVNTRQIAETLANRLLILRANVAIHHGSLAREIRIAAEENFKKGKTQGLVCTSSLELGIDIGDVEKVVQYMSPRQVARMLQRVGRSGHSAERIAKAVVITSDDEDKLEAEVIAEMAKEGLVEREEPHRNALDVLAHQVCGILLEKGNEQGEEAGNTGERSGTTFDYVYSLVTRAYNFSGLPKEELEKVLQQLHLERIIGYSGMQAGGQIRGTGRTREYYYSHLSTIPSQKRMAIRNAATNSLVASLDEAFASTLEKGVLFISKGIPWKVLDMFEDEIIVEPAETHSLAVPDWTGEEIPVSFNVAQRVAGRREKVQTPMPREKLAVIESCEEVIVIHLHAGNRINETIARVLGEIFTTRFGASVFVSSDQYRIVARMPRPTKAEWVKQALLETFDISGTLRNFVPTTSLFRFKLTHVARAFGLLGDDGKMTRKLAEMLKGTPVFDEAMRTFFLDYLDVEGAQKILGEMRGGKIEVETINVGKLTPLGRKGVDAVSASELIAPVEPSSEIVKAFKNGIMEENIRFVCTYCGKYFYRKISKIGAKEKLKCEHCNSPMVAVLNKKNRDLNEKETKKQKKELLKIASLVDAYGKRAVIALSAYGVGVDGATRILQRLHRDEDYLFVDLLEAQKQFIRTKKYWSA